MFGNEAEKMEVAVLRNQRALRCRVDRGALRTKVRAPRTQVGPPGHR